MRKGLGILTIALGLFIVPTTATATPILQINGSGVLSGASGVDVNGTLYDVAFIDGSCSALFQSCNGPADFAFTTEDDANAAATALLNQIFGNGLFDTNPGLTVGCVGTTDDCSILIPFSEAGSLVTASLAINNPGFGPDALGLLTTGRHSDLSSDSGRTFADFTPSSALTAVPEPTSLLLLGTGGVGMIARARRRRREQQ